MAGKNKSESRSPDVIRYIIIACAWAVWIFFMLACLSFNPADPVGSYSTNTYYVNAGPPTNWCGHYGASLAYLLVSRIGPGVYLALLSAGLSLGVWSAGKSLRQLPLRLIGATLLVCVISAAFHLLRFSSALEAGSGGKLGHGIGEFLYQRFNATGSWLILLLTLSVGLLLAADELVLALPPILAKFWGILPKEQIAASATGAASSGWNGLTGMIGNFFAPKPASPTVTAKGAMTGKDQPIAVAVEEVHEDDLPILAAVDRSKSIPEPEAEKIVKPRGRKAIFPIPVPVETVAAPIPPKAEPKFEPELIVRKPNASKLNTTAFKPVVPSSAPQDLANYRLPGLDLLEEADVFDSTNQDILVKENAKILEDTLASFNIDAKVEAIDTGPVVTLYELSLAPGIKSSQVAALSKDIARALKSQPGRVIDNIPGKATMGIELPNIDRDRVRLKELMQLGQDNMQRMGLPMCLGKDASGNPLIEDLTRMPHMLIAGTTGSGKSVCINSIIMTLLLTQRPDHVKLILVDPKMVEMQDYRSIPHLMAPIIDDMTKAESVLEWATHKMDERYEIMSEAGVRHIREFNKLERWQIIEKFKPSNSEEEAKLMFHMPYIVIIIDELADLMMTSKDVEGHIVRIAQKARAVGIHLILATQRPEAQVVTGLIKSNMPGRICFQVRSRLDSRIMLDQSGGELLLGQGDMLMLKPSGGSLLRAQGAFVDDKEIKSVCNFLKEVAQPEFHPELMQIGATTSLSDAERDELFDQAVDIMIETGRGSVSLLQRRLNIGYSRASRLIDQMRLSGYVGAYKGSVASEVLITADQWTQLKLERTQQAEAANAAPGETGDSAGRGKHAGYAQQTSTPNSVDDDFEDDDDGVPDELPGEHRY